LSLSKFFILYNKAKQTLSQIKDAKRNDHRMVFILRDTEFSRRVRVFYVQSSIFGINILDDAKIA